jgi:predicted enzyme related to lactoylglutathione lyase
VARRRGLEAGDVGTVVLVYPKGGYMVEFVDHEGNTLDLAEEEVEPLRGPALLRAKTA